MPALLPEVDSGRAGQAGRLEEQDLGQQAAAGEDDEAGVEKQDRERRAADGEGGEAGVEGSACQNFSRTIPEAPSRPVGLKNRITSSRP